jgi:hypothetical protein
MPAPRAIQAAISHALATWTATVGAKPGAVEIAAAVVIPLRAGERGK